MAALSILASLEIPGRVVNLKGLFSCIGVGIERLLISSSILSGNRCHWRVISCSEG